MNKKLTSGWNKISLKIQGAKNTATQKAKGVATTTKDSLEILNNYKNNFTNHKVEISRAATATGCYLKNSPELLKDLAGETASFLSHIKSQENLEKYKAAINKAAEDTWAHVRESPDAAAEKFKKMDKSHKVLALSAMAGGVVVSIPFIIALGPLSIVSALSTLGLGALSAGGYGVAGGLIVTGGGAVLTATLAGTVANRMIDDPELNELIDNYGKLEEIINQNFQTMENNQAKFKGLYEKYAITADFVIQLKETLEKGEDYDIEEIRDRNNRIMYIIEDLKATIKVEATSDGK